MFFRTPPPKAPQRLTCDIGTGVIDFNALLREAVSGVNNTMQAAVDDLLNLCSQLDEAIQSISGGTLRIKVVELSDSPEEVTYEMQLHDETRHLCSFDMYKVTVSGYPISYGSRGAGSNFKDFESKALSRQDLERHFAELFAKKSSPLVIQVSFALRHAAKCAWPKAA